MKIKTTLFILSSILSVLSTSAFASPHTYNPRINQVQHNQQQRIDEGVDSGELTFHEARRLERGQKRIAHMKRMARADGIVTRFERERIREAQREQSRRIFNKKHNDRNTY